MNYTKSLKRFSAEKIYKLISKDFGHKFSFNAHDFETATHMMKQWCLYHSFYFGDFSVEETTDVKWIHNEYFA